MKMTYISFKERETKNNYAADEVISALQKEIRRGNLESACFFGLELLESGLEFETKFWERILVISVEDIDDDNKIPLIRSLKENYFDLVNSKNWDKHMQAIQAIKILCEAKKGRIISELYDVLQLRKKDGWKVKVPDYALDKHTKKGKEMGRSYNHFFVEAAKIINVNKVEDFRYLNELKKYYKIN
jgi:replication-associated recombination protein RarA